GLQRRRRAEGPLDCRRGRQRHLQRQRADAFRPRRGADRLHRIATDVGNGGRLSDHQADLEDLQKQFGGPWQVFDALGDLARERKDYEAAARFYQLALEDGSNETLTPDWMAPDPDYILRLDRLAGEMRLASPRPVQLAMRGGCKVSFRGVA